MDHDRFDRVAKLLGADFTRRSTLSVLSALGMGGLHARHAVAKSKGKGKKKKRTCKKGYKRCGIYCISLEKCCTNEDCAPCQECSSDGICAERIPPHCTDPCSALKCTGERYECLPCQKCCNELCIHPRRALAAAGVSETCCDVAFEERVCCDCNAWVHGFEGEPVVSSCTITTDGMTLDECGDACDLLIASQPVSVATSISGIVESDAMLGMPFCNERNVCVRKCPQPVG